MAFFVDLLGDIWRGISAPFRTRTMLPDTIVERGVSATPEPLREFVLQVHR